MPLPNRHFLTFFLAVAFFSSESRGFEPSEDFDLRFDQARFSSSANEVAFRGPVTLRLPDWSVEATTGSVLRLRTKIRKGEEGQYGLEQDWGNLIFFGTVKMTGNLWGGAEQIELTLTASCLVFDLEQNKISTTGPSMLGIREFTQAISVDLSSGAVTPIKESKPQDS